MDWFTEFTRLIQQNSAVVVTAILALAVLLLFICIYLIAAVVKLRRKYAFLLRDERTQDLGEVFERLEGRVREIQESHAALSSNLSATTRQMQSCVQKVGLVRYDAFEDIGGQQSFAIALLDSNDDGIVISSIYSRNDCRTYAKYLKDGRAGQNLSEEELQALQQAQQGVRGGSER